MKNIASFIVLCILFPDCSSQTIAQKLEKAYRHFESDSQLSHAISSLYVINAKTGKVVFDKNSQIGLAPASTQKIITAATAFELLGKDFRYQTEFAIDPGEGQSLVAYGTGDPTFGSWRFRSTTDTAIFKTLVEKIKEQGYGELKTVIVSRTGDRKSIPPGWIYEDIANYYGAGSCSLNWHENQYDVDFVPGEVNNVAGIVMSPAMKSWKYVDNEVTTAPAGSGDNAYIYFLPGEMELLIQGTVPAGVKKFTIAGADPDPMTTFSFALIDYANDHGLKFRERPAGVRQFLPMGTLNRRFFTYYSPSLDSIVYWFLQRSINLYGEALLKTFATEKRGFAATDTGVAVVKEFWKGKGFDPSELNIKDGSGLSPQNRVTTHAEVEVLRFARQQPWFPNFSNSLPEFNNMRMKSGSIGDVKGFCGYHTAGDGTEYVFSFLVNNYSGSSSTCVQKMYKVLDMLK